MKYQSFTDEVLIKKFRTIEGASYKRSKDAKKNSTVIFSSYKRLVGYPLRHPIHFFAAMFFSLMSQIGEVVLPFISGRVMDAIHQKDYDDFQDNSFLYLAGVLISSISIFFRTTLIVTISDLVSNLLKNEAFEK